MITLVYVSAARRLFSPEKLSELLAISRRNNEAKGLTGMLLYADGNFMQALEGEAEIVDAVTAKIERDPRHHAMNRLIRMPITERQFGHWSMALRQLDDLPEADRLSCEALVSAKLDGKQSDTPSVALKLLQSFRQSMK